MKINEEWLESETRKFIDLTSIYLRQIFQILGKKIDDWRFWLRDNDMKSINFSTDRVLFSLFFVSSGIVYLYNIEYWFSPDLIVLFFTLVFFCGFYLYSKN